MTNAAAARERLPAASTASASRSTPALLFHRLSRKIGNAVQRQPVGVAGKIGEYLGHGPVPAKLLHPGSVHLIHIGDHRVLLIHDHLGSCLRLQPRPIDSPDPHAINAILAENLTRLSPSGLLIPLSLPQLVSSPSGEVRIVCTLQERSPLSSAAEKSAWTSLLVIE